MQFLKKLLGFTIVAIMKISLLLSVPCGNLRLMWKLIVMKITCYADKCRPIFFKTTLAGFFPGGGGDHGKNFAHLLQPTAVPTFWPEPVFPQLSFVPENFKNFTSFFSQFWPLFSSKLHQKALFYAWNTKICSNFAVGGHFWPQRTIFFMSPFI